MKRDEYKSLIRDIGDPYAVWIREKEIRREEGELHLPENYTLFLDRDGDIDPKIAAALSEYRAFEDGFDLIYTDEDERDRNGRRHDPFFKPDHSPHTLESFYYPGGLTIVRNDLIESVEAGGTDAGGRLEFLRECARASKKPLHIPEVMYHALSHHKYGYRDPGKDAGKGAVRPDSLAVIILSKDHPELLENCVSGLFAAADRENIRLECVVIDNGSLEENRAKYEELSAKYGFSYYFEERDFVYSALCNRGVSLTKSEILLFLNDDIEVPSGRVFLKKMMGEAVKDKTGAVGCKLLYPGGERIQHCGITLLKSGASHCFSGYSDDKTYGRGINRVKRNVFAVTGACLMVKRDRFNEAGGFDEELSVAYTDVDLCASLVSLKYYNVCLNDFYLIHHESLSRKSDSEETDKFFRLKKEREYFYRKYDSLIKNGDPWYNVNLTGTELDMGVAISSLTDRVPFFDATALSSAPANARNCKKASEGELLYNIEYCGVRQSDAVGHENFLEISGWGFVHGKPGYEYDIKVLLKDGDRAYFLNTGRIKREDLIIVFPKERDILLSGFSVKVDITSLSGVPDKGDIALCFTGRDFFGRDRGFITL